MQLKRIKIKDFCNEIVGKSLQWIKDYKIMRGSLKTYEIEMSQNRGNRTKKQRK